MFTLKQVQTVHGWNGSAYLKDVHIKTLANDFDKAVAKATEYLGETPFTVCATETEAIAEKREIDHSVMPHGKYQGQSINDVDDSSYFAWYWENNRMKKSAHKLISNIEANLIETGELVEQGGELMTKTAIASQKRHDAYEAQKEAWAEERKGRKHFPSNVGDKAFVGAKCIGHNSFDGQFGTCNIFRFLSGQFVLVYMGGKCDWNVGEEYSLQFTVKKFDEYKDEKQTHISYIKTKLKSEDVAA